MTNITMVITSCERFDLLKQTLDTFIGVGCGGSKPDTTIIVEDSAAPMPDWLKNNIQYYSSNIGVIQWVSNGGRRGQIYSIDRAYSMVKTDLIFHCEDDFLFLRGGGWMQQSKDILAKNPKISMVSLRGWDCNGHPNIDMPPYEGFKIQSPNWKGGWGGINFNPGLRRLSDYKKIGTYGRHVQYGVMGLGTELPLSKLFLEMGYRIAVLLDENKKDTPIARHQNILSKMNDGFVVPLPKVLIAIPVCYKFDYTRWESSESPAYNQANAWEGKPYGTDIHISGENNRIQAIRDTWWKDVVPFSHHVDAKFFYGSPSPEGWVQQPDEVILPCPDDYAHLAQKSILICKYAKDHGYDLLFKCDDDTGVYVERVLHEALWGQWDYAGYTNGRTCTGGTGYWLSKRAIEIIAESASPNHWAEDVTIGKTLFHHNIQPQHLEGHIHGRQDHWFWKNGFTPTERDMSTVTAFHAVRPKDMRDWYAWKEAQLKVKVK
jgi:hypothetical protein